MYSRGRKLPLLTPVLSVAVGVAIACGSSGAVAIAAASHSHHKTASQATLSGTWSGQYGGAYHGTFTLHWKQTGSRLTGTIKLSNPSATLSVNGTVHASTIRFGTVGSAAITYSGSVSHKSMSGSYKTPGGGGPWSAHKT